ncbi:hypothetical protein HYD55_01115 [Mycoplasmopsis bovis]|nr:hypothetical protein [Mycoplasmopsis bovis]QQH71547.1 hypothetical protein HYD55_01115 [Mycoplasmopsis bovis]
MVLTVLLQILPHKLKNNHKARLTRLDLLDATQDKKIQKENPSGSGNSSTDTAPQTQGNQNRIKKIHDV